MESSAESPLKEAPYPTLVGTAITGQSANPPITLASAPSIPAMAMITLASIIISILAKSRCTPDTPTSYSLNTSLPKVSAVIAASSATGMSLVPPVATTIFPMPEALDFSPIRPILASLKYVNPTLFFISSAFSPSSLVIRIFFWPFLTIASIIPMICSGVFPEPNTTSGTP